MAKGGMSVRRLILVVTLLVLFLSSGGVAARSKTPPGLWPDGYTLMYYEDYAKFSPARLGLWVLEDNAMMGTISPDGEYLAYVGKGPYLIVKAFALGGPGVHEAKYEIPWGICPLWSPDSRKLLYSKAKEDYVDEWTYRWLADGIYELDIATGVEREVISGTVYPGSFSPDGKTLYYTMGVYSSYDQETAHGTSYIMSIAADYSGEPKEVIPGGLSPLVSPVTEDVIAMSGYDGGIGILHRDMGKVESTFKGMVGVRPVAYSPDGTILFVEVPVPLNPEGPPIPSNVVWTVHAYFGPGKGMSFLERWLWSFKDMSIRKGTREFVVSTTLPY